MSQQVASGKSQQLEASGCEDEDEESLVPNFTILIYGGGGDLSRKKLLPTIFHLYKQKLLPPNFTVVAAGSPQNTTEDQFRDLVRESLIENAADDYNAELFGTFIPHVFFLSGRFENDEYFTKLKELVEAKSPREKDGTIRIVHYLSVPPFAFETVVRQIGKYNMNNGTYDAKLIIEKPFGTDLATSIELNGHLQAVFKENQIYRIDHYLGKETVQNIMFFRFSNSIFEPVWNNRYIDNVQITVTEDLGIESRGKFYESAGVIRDIIQNHALQLVAMVAMEPPVSFEADAIRDEKSKIFRSIEVMDQKTAQHDTVFGQYGEGKIKGQSVPAYRSEEFVNPESQVPTYFAGKFAIKNWRWSGVPFYVRAGKRLGKRITEIVIQFKKPPYQLFGSCQGQEPSTLTLTVQPEEAITLHYEVKYPNTIKRVWPVNMKFSYGDHFNVKSLPAYARLILDCLKGDLTLFVRQDGIESMWEVSDPIINAKDQQPMEFPNYASGSHGPKAADQLLARDGRRWLTKLS